MSDTIDVSEPTPKVVVSVVPMQINYTGEAKTQEYFSASRTKEPLGDRVCDVAYFRGRKLVGESYPLKTHTGYITTASESLARNEHSDPGSDEVYTIKRHTPEAHFDAITVFGHDGPAESTNPWALIEEWQEVANILHE